MTNTEAIRVLECVRRREKQHNDKINKLCTSPSESIGVQAIDTAIQVLKRENQPGDWISVEDELPKSGKHVLLCCEDRPSGHKYICDGYYAEENDITQGGQNDTVFQYSDEDDEYYLVEGFYEVVKNWDGFNSVSIDDFVTHWMPLPEPPEVRKGMKL